MNKKKDLNNASLIANASLPAESRIDATYFYGDTCSHCAKVKPVLDDLERRNPDLRLTRLEVYTNATNRERLTVLSQASGVQNPGVPIIFIGKDVLIGDLEITSRFEAEIVAERERIASCNTTVPVNPSPVDPGCAPATPSLSLPLVIFAALVDSTNPCGLSVLVFLLISMAAAGDKKRILLVGGAYIAAMFLFHLLVGIGLFSVFSLSGLAKIFSLIGGAVALILGVITIADLLRNRETFLLSIPESRKGLLGNYIRMASPPGSVYPRHPGRGPRVHLHRGHLHQHPRAHGQGHDRHERAAVAHPLQLRVCPAPRHPHAPCCVRDLTGTGRPVTDRVQAAAPAPHRRDPHRPRVRSFFSGGWDNSRSQRPDLPFPPLKNCRSRRCG